jgi:glycerol-3-phosphate dehydrogenase
VARLDGASVDLLVVGAGIVGASTAWAAARAGARVAVVDRGDLAGATSSASSKLLHGGLRYLAMGDIGLVREAHAERRVNAEVIAPHLVSPLDFLVPIRAGSPVPLWKVRGGVWLYGLLARFADGRNGSLPSGEAMRRVPGLRADGLEGTVLYHDHETHDGRLTMSVLQAAAGLGAIVAPHVEVAGLRIAGSRVAGAELRDAVSGGEFHITASSVVNATGPWVDHMRRMESPDAGTSVRLSKGAHLLMDSPAGWDAAVTTPLPGGRVTFAIPWEGMLLLGTTDEPFDGEPADVAASDADERQILEEAAWSLDPALLVHERLRSRFAGVRVLPVSGRGTAGTRRETVVSVGRHGMVSVAGGKLTTWRRIGLEAAGVALDAIGVRIGSQVPRPVPGAAPASEVGRRIAAAWPQLPPDVRAALSRHHGTVALDMLERCRDRPELLERIDPDGPDLWVQVPHAHDHEWASTPEDVTRRRTLLGLRGLDGEPVRRRVAELLAEGGA